MILSEVDTLWAADEFINYFNRFKSIEDYIRYTKEAAVKESCLLYTSPSPRDSR